LRGLMRSDAYAGSIPAASTGWVPEGLPRGVGGTSFAAVRSPPPFRS
jgi:hypothetical protein